MPQELSLLLASPVLRVPVVLTLVSPAAVCNSPLAVVVAALLSPLVPSKESRAEGVLLPLLENLPWLDQDHPRVQRGQKVPELALLLLENHQKPVLHQPEVVLLLERQLLVIHRMLVHPITRLYQESEV